MRFCAGIAPAPDRADSNDDRALIRKRESPRSYSKKPSDTLQESSERVGCSEYVSGHDPLPSKRTRSFDQESYLKLIRSEIDGYTLNSRVTVNVELATSSDKCRVTGIDARRAGT